MGSTTKRVAIVGAGPGGLAAAVLLAASGVEVTVYESQPTIGGRTKQITATSDAGDTYRFDCGPTFFLMPYVLDEIFAAAGTSMHEHVELTRLDPMYRLIIGRKDRDNLVLDTTQDVAEMGRRIGEVNRRDGEAFARFIADNRKKLALSEPILRKPIRSPLDLIDTRHLPIVPILKPHKSVHQLLGEYFTDEHVKLAVCFQSKYLGMSPYECPSLFTILPFIEYEFGIWHPTGGCHALMAALAKVAENAGATIETDAPVERAIFDGVRATGVVVRGKRHDYDAVVVNADAAWALKKLVPGDLRRAGPAAGYSDNALDNKRYSCSTMMLYLGLEGEVDLPHHTIYTSESYRQNLDDIAVKGALSDDPSVYVCNPSRLDPTLAPEGHSSLYVLVPTPSLKPGAGGSAVNWPAEAPQYRERALDQVERVFGIADVRERIRAEVQLTPEDWRGMNINFGATFNLAHNLGQMLHWRPQNRLKGFERMYLVGGGTHPGSGLPTIFLSSQISARLLCEDLGVPYAGDAAPKLSIEQAGQLAGV